MNQFEEISRYLLEAEGFWVQTGIKVEITPEQKRFLGKPTMPRPEVDIVAYKRSEDTLYLIEAKTYLNSKGVVYDNIVKRDFTWDKYKILTYSDFQDIVGGELKADLIKKGLIHSKTKVRYGLIAAKLYKPKENDFYGLAKERNWFFWGPDEVKSRLSRLINLGYEDNPYSIVAKIIQN